MNGPRHVVVYGELSPEQKRNYSKLIIDNHIKFSKNEDGLFVATVRLTRPMASPVVEPTLKPVSLRERLNHINVLAVPEAMRRYTTLYCMLEGAANVDLTKPPLTDANVIKVIHDIYDARRDEPGVAVEEEHPFCSYVMHYFQTRYGLQSLVEQYLVDFLSSLHAHKEHLEVEVFSSFLDGTYDDAALAFFLEARAKLVAITIRDALGVKINVAKDSIWVSKAQCFVLAHQIYGARSGAPYLTFMTKFKDYLACQPVPRSVHETMEMNEFLSLALETRNAVLEIGESDYTPETKENLPMSPRDEKRRLLALLQRVRHRQDNAMTPDPDDNEGELGWVPHQEHGQPWPPSPKSPAWK
ncbi:hypothetical protein ACHHYP_12561 [Achlya hypogyna]|uniref:Uncharacterized protein n=1 Tax=Achlya hypogyna TaxID=1202772 RepID=A0A1V9YGS1_ACHHY|nr:hypothetical protein ACHHYP_12561 [Achlya hypogyna]